MKQKFHLLRLILTFLLVLLLFYPLGNVRSPFGDLSVTFFRRLFQNEAAREVFGLSREEAVEVFGQTQKENFV